MEDYNNPRRDECEKAVRAVPNIASRLAQGASTAAYDARKDSVPLTERVRILEENGQHNAEQISTVLKDLLGRVSELERIVRG